MLERSSAGGRAMLEDLSGVPQDTVNLACSFLKI
jgi:hypothetical protein